MRMHAFALLLAVAGPTQAIADDKAPPPPTLPSAQAPLASAAPPQTVTLQVVPQAPATPPASAPQAVTLNVQAAPAPQQTVTLQVVPQATAAAPVQVAAAPAVLPARVHYPGALRTAVGNFGELLARQKMARVYVPVAQADVQVTQAAARVQLAPVQVQAQPQIQAETMPVLASPQAPAKHRLFGLGR